MKYCFILINSQSLYYFKISLINLIKRKNNEMLKQRNKERRDDHDNKMKQRR